MRAAKCPTCHGAAVPISSHRLWCAGCDAAWPEARPASQLVQENIAQAQQLRTHAAQVRSDAAEAVRRSRELIRLATSRRSAGYRRGA